MAVACGVVMAATPAAAVSAPGAPAASTQAGPSSHADHLVGTWFEPWFNRTTQQTWKVGGDGAGATTGLVGDVTGDGVDDAVVVKGSDWYLAPSSGTAFTAYIPAATGLGTAASDHLLGDIDGDHRADAIVVENGTWRVALSTGHGFAAAVTWAAGAATGRHFVADADGDGKADAITYDPQRGWSIALSTGTSFAPAADWGGGAGKGATPLVDDVTGDGKVDAVTVSGDGTWSAGVSDGHRFGAATVWLRDFGGGGAIPMLGDVTTGAGTPDGAADAVIDAGGRWSIALSNRSSAFTDPISLTPYRAGFGGNTPVDVPYGAGADQVFVGNTYGKNDPTGSLIAFTASTGLWEVTGADNFYYKQKNRWEAWNCDYVPESAPGVFRQYDTADPAVIHFQLQQLADAGIDFLIFDETNGLHVDDNSIFGPNLAFVHELAKWNADPDNRPIRYALAIGVVNYTHDIHDIEREAGEVWNTFADDPTIGGPRNAQYVDGKPLLVLYTYRAMRDEWLDSDIDKTNTDHFHMGYAEGPLYQGYYGWYNPLSGPIPDRDVMYVSPRKADPNGELFGRSLDYYAQSWQAAIKADPRIVVTGAYNDYQENSWWAPTDTSGLPPDMQRYEAPGDADPYAAYTMTKKYVLEFTVTVDSIEAAVTDLADHHDLTAGQADRIRAWLGAAERSHERGATDDAVSRLRAIARYTDTLSAPVRSRLSVPVRALADKWSLQG